jgi:DNA mismatch endonuclease (patch repair protein)
LPAALRGKIGVRGPQRAPTQECADAQAIEPEEYEELPEMTDEMSARNAFKKAARPMRRKGRRRAQDTTPEAVLRRVLHAHGLRFGLRPRALPGRPDLVLPGRHSVVFVRECFWHGHGCALDRAAARFKAGAWAEKIAANRAQDARDRAALQAAGWQVEAVWECQVDQEPVISQLAARLLRR